MKLSSEQAPEGGEVGMPYSMYAPERIVTNDVSFSYSYSIISGSWEITWNIPEKYINPNPPSPHPIPTDTPISLFVFAFFAKVCNVNFGGFTWNKPKQTISFFCLKEPLLPLQWELKITKKPIFSNSISFSILLQYLTEPSAFLETVIYLPSLPVNNSQSCQTRTYPASYILYPL